MGKLSSIEYTHAYYGGYDGNDCNSDVHILNLLSELSSNWIRIGFNGDQQQYMIEHIKLVYNISDDGWTCGFGFRVDAPSSSYEHYMLMAIDPFVAKLTHHDTRPASVSDYDWDEEHKVLISDIQTIPTHCLFPDGFGPYTTDEENSKVKYTVVESKNKKHWTVSAVEATKTFEVFSSYVGFDSTGQPYALIRSKKGNNNTLTFLNEQKRVPSTWPDANRTVDLESGIPAGFGPTSSDLSLIPYINPVTGARCTDLYWMYSGPKSLQVYDIQIGSRSFVCGSSRNTAKDVAMTDTLFEWGFCLFTEV